MMLEVNELDRGDTWRRPDGIAWRISDRFRPIPKRHGVKEEM